MLQEKARRKNENKLKYYKPYAKQLEFHMAGANNRERLFMAGNQLGKTIAGGYEAAMHATGLYPEDWKGKTFDEPTKGWASGVTGESTRDNPQRILMGDVGKWGTGTIPKHLIIGYTRARGVPDLLDTVFIRHKSGGVSQISFKAYEKGREKWQGETLHWVWFDEEPPLDIYTEGLTRTNVKAGITFVTFTPLLGMSATVMRFLDTKNRTPGTHVTTMTIDDAEHYTPEQREAIKASYPAHERDARANGTPILGSGRIFPIEEAAIKCAAFPIPDHWVRIGGLDFGWDHPTAGIELVWDRDADRFYVTKIYRAEQVTPLVVAGALKPWGDWMPWAWPHDGLQHDKGSGEQLAQQYRNQGMKLTDERATFEDGSNGVEAGLTMMLELMQTGRFKVFDHLTEWFEEFRLYHRKDGKVVKLQDDLISATRYAMMMKRFAKTKPKPFKQHTYKKIGAI